MTRISFTVFGETEPAGSKVATKWGVRDANPKSKPWKMQVAGEAAKAMGYGYAAVPILVGPLMVAMVFYRPRPKGHYKPSGALSAAGQRNPFPATRPDALKLARAVEDAMSGIVYRDDAQIVHEVLYKRWGEPARVEVDVVVVGGSGIGDAAVVLEGESAADHHAGDRGVAAQGGDRGIANSPLPGLDPA